MSRIKKQAKIAVSIFIAVFAFSIVANAQEGESAASKKAEAEMKSSLGQVPVMMEVYPENMRAEAWEWFKSGQNPDAAIPAKYAELISLGVASQIPCNYCVYAHTTMAKALGATDEEIEEAVASAAETRHWSTILNGNSVPFEKFKSNWDAILAHMQEQGASK
jgi:AhpD family alkylhydroperoxidase